MSNRFTHDEMTNELSKLVWSKARWLEDFSTGRNQRPESEIETKRRELAVLHQAEDDYRKAARRVAS